MATKHFTVDYIGGIEVYLKHRDILPLLTREVLDLHYVQLIPRKTICTMLNKSMTVVRNLHNTGLFQIKTHLEKIEINPDKKD